MHVTEVPATVATAKDFKVEAERVGLEVNEEEPQDRPVHLLSRHPASIEKLDLRLVGPPVSTPRPIDPR